MSLYYTCLKKATYRSSIFCYQEKKRCFCLFYRKRGVSHVIVGHFMIVKQIITQVNRLFCQINRIHLSLHPVISSDELLFYYN